jgi:Zn-dependent peptidase ImmA (M78 family)
MNIGLHVHRRREQFGFSGSQLAALAHMETARLEAIEAGAVLSTHELASLADALAIDPSKLRAGDMDDIYRSVVRFRSAEGGKPLSPGDLRLLARGAEAGRMTAWLKGLLNEPASELLTTRQVQGVTSRSTPWQQGYKLGEAARLRLAPTPVGRLDSIQKLLEKVGVHVAFVAFESSHIEAASLFEPQAAPVILLNTSVTRNRYALSRRAILAHELCHLLFDGGQRHLLTQISWENDASPTEQRANGFAPSFLAPKKWVRVHAKEPLEIVQELAERWGLSFEGAAWHAKNLRFITPDAAEHLWRISDRPRIQTQVEPDLVRTSPEQFGIDVEITPLANGLLSELALRACAEGAIDRQRAAEILSLQ